MVLNPLIHLLRKRAAWVWSKKCQEAFQAIKGMLSSDQVLARYYPTLPWRLVVGENICREQAWQKQHHDARAQFQ